MKYKEFRSLIQNDLLNNPSGKTWMELKHYLELPYDRPCPAWVERMEHEIGLIRNTRKGRELLWRLQTPHEKR